MGGDKFSRFQLGVADVDSSRIGNVAQVFEEIAPLRPFIVVSIAEMQPGAVLKSKRASKVRTPQQWATYSEDMRKVNDALEQISYEQREVVLLHVHGAMKFKAISQLQNVSINTVQSRYRYALEKLRVVLKEQMPG